MVASSLKWISENKAVFLFILCLSIFPIAIGNVHLFDWDEVNFAEISREMIATGNYVNVQINFLPFWEKPPLFFWLQSLSMHVFGINEFASRFPNTIIGIISIMLLYFTGKKIFSEKFGFIWALSYFGSVLPHFYFKTGIIDPLFNLFIFLSLLYFYQYQLEYKKSKMIITAIFAGLSVLTKGPVALIIIFLVILIFILLNRKTFQFKILDLFFGTIIILLITSLWFVSEIFNGGGIKVLIDFFDYQVRLFSTSEAGHGQPFYYHFIVLFFGCFPISLIAFPTILKIKNDKSFPILTQFYQINFLLFWVVLILFSITTTKIVHYSSLCYFPLSFLAAYTIYQLLEKKQKISKVSYLLLIFVGGLLSFIFTALPLIIKFKKYIIPSIKDPFAVENILYPVHWSGFEFLIGIFYIIVMMFILHKIKTDIKYIIPFFIANAFFLNLLMYFIVPKVEQHVQGSMIAFFAKNTNQNQYVLTYGFRSYAQYFYTNKKNPSNKLALSDKWLLEGKTDKPVLIVSKIQEKENVLKLSNIRFLYQDGGFAFFVRNEKK